MQCAAGEVTYCILSVESVPGEIYLRNSSCALNLISTVLLNIIAKKDWTEMNDVNAYLLSFFPNAFEILFKVFLVCVKKRNIDRRMHGRMVHNYLVTTGLHNLLMPTSSRWRTSTRSYCIFFFTAYSKSCSNLSYALLNVILKAVCVVEWIVITCWQQT